MKNKRFKQLLYCIFALVFSSCLTNKENTRVVQLHEEYDIVIDRQYDRSCPYYGIGSHHYDNGIVAEGIKWSSQQYLKYNISDSVLCDSLLLRVKPHNMVNDYYFIDKDTILIALNPSYEFDLHDAIILLIDRNRNVIDSFPLYDFPVKSRRRLDITDPERMFVSYFYFPLACKYDKVVVPMVHWGHHYSGLPGDSVMGIVNIKTKESSKLPIAPPAAPDGYYWGYFYTFPRGLNVDDDMYIFFGTSPILYKYNYKTGDLSSNSVSFETIEDIMPYKFSETNPQFDPYRSQYDELFYDSARKLLYWTAKVKCDTTDGPFSSQYVNFIYSFVILDENLQKMGEGILPEGYSNRIIPYKDGFLLFKRNQQKLTYTYFTYSIQDEKVEILKDQIKNRREKYNNDYPKLSKDVAFTNYVKKIIGEKYAYFKRFVIIPASSCPSCVPAYAHILKNNRSTFLQNETAVILIDNDTAKINEFLESIDENRESNELKINKIPVYCDTTDEFQYYFNKWINLRCVELDSKKKKIIFDNIVNPSNIMDLETFLNKE